MQGERGDKLHLITENLWRGVNYSKSGLWSSKREVHSMFQSRPNIFSPSHKRYLTRLFPQKSRKPMALHSLINTRQIEGRVHNI